MSQKRILSYKRYSRIFMVGGADGDEDEGVSPEDLIQQGESVEPIADAQIESGEDAQIPEPSYVPLYTIPVGTILYHGSKTKETFDPKKITLGDDTLAAFFTPNKRFAADYISGCAGGDVGYIHMFKVHTPITQIYVISPHNKKDGRNIEELESKFCKGTEFGRLNGVGFFVKDDLSNGFVDGDEQDDNVAEPISETTGGGKIPMSSEFAICDPSSFLEYISTQRCQSARNLSKSYTFAA